MSFFSRPARTCLLRSPADGKRFCSTQPLGEGDRGSTPQALSVVARHGSMVCHCSLLAPVFSVRRVSLPCQGYPWLVLI